MITTYDALLLASGMFAGAPSQALVDQLTQFPTALRSAYAIVGNTPFAQYIFTGTSHERATKLADNILGNTVSPEVRAEAISVLVNLLNAYDGNIGLVAYDALNYVLTSGDSRFAKTKTQLENRFAVAQIHAQHNTEAYDLDILKTVTDDLNTRNTALEHYKNISVQPPQLAAINPHQLIDKAQQLTVDSNDTLQSFGENNIFQARANALNVNDRIVDSSTTDQDVLYAILGRDNDGASPTIRNVEHIQLYIDGIGRTFNAQNISNGLVTLRIDPNSNIQSSLGTQITGLANNGVNFDLSEKIQHLTLKGIDAKTTLTTRGQSELNLDTQSIHTLKLENNHSTTRINLKADRLQTLETSGRNNFEIFINASQIHGKKINGDNLNLHVNIDTDTLDLSNVDVKMLKLSSGSKELNTLTLREGSTVSIDKAALFTPNATIKLNEEGNLNLIMNEGTQTNPLRFDANVKTLNLSGNSPLKTSLDLAGKTIVNFKNTQAITLDNVTAPQTATLNFSDVPTNVDVKAINANNGVYFIGNQSGMRITGSQGNDTIIGGMGNDTIMSSAGEDQILSGSGFDTYVVTQQAHLNPAHFSDFEVGKDRVALAFEETTANVIQSETLFSDLNYAINQTLKLNSTVANKAYKDVLKFGFENTPYQLHANTAQFVGSNVGDFVKVGTNTSRVQLGGGEDLLDLGASANVATSVVFEKNAQENGQDQIKNFQINAANGDKFSFVHLAPDAFIGTNGAVQAGNGLAQAFTKAESNAVSLNQKVALVHVEAGKNTPAALATEFFGNGKAFKLDANQSGVLVSGTAGSNTAHVFYVENDGNADVTANEVKLVGTVEMTGNVETLTVNAFV